MVNRLANRRNFNTSAQCMQDYNLDQSMRGFIVLCFLLFLHVACPDLTPVHAFIAELLFRLILNWFFGNSASGGAPSNCCKTRERCSICTRHRRLLHKNRPFILHSLAFGGRGIFSTGKINNGSSLNLNLNSCLCLLLITTLVLTLGVLLVTHQTTPIFDANLGYPGEGPLPKSAWSSNEPALSMALWNSRSLTYERFYYCKSLQYDVLVLTELWRSAHKFVDGTIRWTHSKARLDEDGKPIYPKDSPAGVGILLSERAQSKYLGHGSP